MNSIYIGDRPLDPPEDEWDEDLINCWSCLRTIEVEAVNDCESCCPKCGVEIDIEHELTDAERRKKAFDDFDPPDNDYGGDL